MPMRWRLAAVGWLLLGTPIAAQDQSFDGRTDVVLVEVPVVVSTAAGEPVRGLGKDDFELFDDGRRQQVAGFQVVDLEPLDPASPLPQIPTAARRHFLLLFDLAFSSPAAIVRAQQTARRFALETLHPSDLAAAASFTLEDGPQLLVTFTADRAQLARAIDTLSPRETKDLEHRHLRAWSQSLGEMAERLAVLAGRKQVLYFTEGFDTRLLFGRVVSPDEGELRGELRALEHGEIWRSDTDARFGSAELRTDVEAMLEAFRRAGCTLHTIDVAGLRNDAPGHDVLAHLASATGGERIAAAADLAGALAKMLKTSVVTYLLSFYPAPADRPGEEHRLEVEIRDLPRGARIVHRPVYQIPRPPAELHPFEKNLLHTETTTFTPRRELDLEVLAVPFTHGAEPAYVAVILELDGTQLLTGVSGTTLPVELYAWATDPEGRMRASFSEKLDLDLSQTRKQLETGLSYYAHLDLEPGDYRLQILARESQTGRTSVETRELRVPKPSEPWLSPPLFPVAGNGLRLREKTPPTARGTVIYPFLDAGRPFIPSARPEIAPGEGVTFFLFCQALPAGDLELKASFEQGTETRALEPRLVKRRQGEPETLVIAIDTQGLGEGEGVLKVKLNGVETAIAVKPGKR